MIHGANPSDHALPFQVVFYSYREFFPRFPAGSSARQPAPSTDGLLGLSQVTADGASSVRAFVSEVRLGTLEHDATFITAGDDKHHSLHDICILSI